MPPPSDTRGRHVLTHSRMTCGKTCMRKHHLRYERGWVPAGQRSLALRFGTAFHLCQETFDLAQLGGMSWEDALDHAVAAVVAQYEVLPDWANEHTWATELEAVVQVFVAHAFHWGQDGYECIAPEQDFELPITNPAGGRASRTFVKRGKIDRIAKLGDQRLAVQEYKTSGWDIDPASDFWRRVELDQQISLYMLAARELGHDVATVIYDVTRRPELRSRNIPLLDEQDRKIVLDAEGKRVWKAPTPVKDDQNRKIVNDKAGARVWNEDGTPRETARPKQGETVLKAPEPRGSGDEKQGFVLQTRLETPEEFGERLAADIAQRPEFYFQRKEVTRTDRHLAEFQAELWDTATSFREAARRGFSFRNTSACLAPFRCEYLDICAMEFDEGHAAPAGFESLPYVHPELVEAAT